jgi:hypothetical protein
MLARRGASEALSSLAARTGVRIETGERHFHKKTSLRADDPLSAVRLRASVGHVIALAIEADDEHRAPVAIASRLIGSEHGRVSAFGCSVADAFAEAAVAEFVGAAKEFDGIVGVIGSQNGFHGPVMLVAKGKDVRPHAKVSVTP